MNFKNIWPYIVILILSFTPLFMHLGSFPIQLWDESRLVTSAYEMCESDNIFIPTYQNGTDLWNTKPPLMIWLQCTSFHLLGVSEFSARLPSALCGLASVFLIFLFFKHQLKQQWSGLAVVVVLCTCSGLMGYHCFRTADYEALLVLTYLMQVISFFTFLQSDQHTKSKKWLLFFILSVVLGIYSKGINSLFLLPAFFLFFILTKKYKSLSILDMGIALSSLLFLGSSYYLIREAMEPGFIRQVDINEITGRFNTSIDYNSGGPMFYLRLFPTQTGPWFYLLLPVILLGYVLGNKQNRFTLSYFSFLSTFFYIVIHLAKTKTLWYNLPIIPLLAILLVLGGRIIFIYLNQKWSLSKPSYLYSIIIISLFVPSLYQTYHDVLRGGLYPKGQKSQYAITQCLRQNIQNTTLDGMHFFDPEYSANNWWYLQRMSDSGIDIKRVENIDSLKIGDRILTNESELNGPLGQDSSFMIHENTQNVLIWIKT